MSGDVERKKPFSYLEKDLFLSITKKYDAILSSKQTNATTSLKKKKTWELIKEEYNSSSIVTKKATCKQLSKLRYNLMAKSRESKPQKNGSFLTGGRSSIIDMNLDSKVMDSDKNILSHVDITDSNVIFSGDNNCSTWNKIGSSKETEQCMPPKKNIYNETNHIDYLKCKILEEELDYKQKLHQIELSMKMAEMEYKEKLHKIDVEIKTKTLKSMDN